MASADKAIPPRFNIQSCAQSSNPNGLDSLAPARSAPAGLWLRQMSFAVGPNRSSQIHQPSVGSPCRTGLSRLLWETVPTHSAVPERAVHGASPHVCRRALKFSNDSPLRTLKRPKGRAPTTGVPGALSRQPQIPAHERLPSQVALNPANSLPFSTRFRLGFTTARPDIQSARGLAHTPRPFARGPARAVHGASRSSCSADPIFREAFRLRT